MLLRIRADLTYRFDPPGQALFKILAARTDRQSVLEESLSLSGDHVLREDMDALTGERLLRGALSGEVALRYEAVVENGTPSAVGAPMTEAMWDDLPVEVVPFLLPSLYCPLDPFTDLAQAQFGSLSGGARVLAVADWVRSVLTYKPGSSTSVTTAEDTLRDRAGVCRDFTHVGISLCRVLGVPARAVAAYAHRLDPPDFHSVMEVWLSDGWHLIDLTGMAPVEGLVPIAWGRDAADIAFLTTEERCRFVRQSVRVEAA